MRIELKFNLCGAENSEHVDFIFKRYVYKLLSLRVQKAFRQVLKSCLKWNSAVFSSMQAKKYSKQNNPPQQRITNVHSSSFPALSWEWNFMFEQTQNVRGSQDHKRGLMLHTSNARPQLHFKTNSSVFFIPNFSWNDRVNLISFMHTMLIIFNVKMNSNCKTI